MVTRIFLLAVSLLGSRVEAAPRRSELSPDAAAHNDRGVALLSAGDPAAAMPELLAAYAAMPDALRWRAGRGKVLGSLRSALNQLYSDTYDPVHLCGLQRLLREHIEALLLALGDDAGPDAVVGSLARLREVRVELADRRCDGRPVAEPAPAMAGVAPTIRSPAIGARVPVRAPGPVSVRYAGRPRRIASGVLFGAGFVGLSGMVLGAIFYVDSRSHLQAIGAGVVAAGREPTSAERHDAEHFLGQGQRMRALAIAGGVIGGVAVIAGAIVRAQGLRRSRPRTARMGAGGSLLRVNF